MKSPVSRFAMKHVLWIGLLIAGCGFFAQHAKAQKKQDTVSAGGVQFTSIPTAADSIKIRKRQHDSLAAAQAMHTTEQVTQQAAHISSNLSKVKSVDQSLWDIFWTGVASGFGAFLMTCIYPLLPLTVSFFTKLGGNNKLKTVGLSLLYMLSIIVVYVSLGLILTIFFGPDTMNALATSGAFNIIVFLLLVVFGASFLGAFEITLPSSLVNKVDQMSDKGGMIGIFFMALTLVVV